MDEELLTALAHFQEQLQEITDKFHDMKEITYNMYKENEKLKRENRRLKKYVFDKKSKDKDESDRGKGFSNLNHLYDEGYHVCHASFGEKRGGDCLFCRQLLDNKFEAD